MNGEAMYNESNFTRAAQLERSAKMLQEEFQKLTKAKSLLDRDSNGSLSTLQLQQDDPYIIDASLLNVTVRFQLLVTYKSGRPSGRVACLNKYSVFGKEYFDVLDSFNMDVYGQTDLSASTNGEIRYIEANADEIVLEFLDKAFEQGPKLIDQDQPTAATEI
jgi:hypothetical protein